MKCPRCEKLISVLDVLTTLCRDLVDHGRKPDPEAITWRQYEEGIASQQARAGYVD